jgi:putative sigma-54 modulation protein
MRIEFTGRQTEVPDAVRALAERKLLKLARTLPRISRAHVVLAVDRRRHAVEVTLHSPHLDLTATEAGSDFGSALRAALDKVERQALRQRGRWRERKRRTDARAAEAVAPVGRARAPEAAVPPETVEPTRVVRVRRAAVKPMTLDEAVREMGGRDDRPLVFRDARTEALKVLFKRGDGQLGLIEPEL